VTGLDPYGDNFLSLREGPGADYDEIERMGPGTQLQVIGRSGAWLRVRLDDGLEGWAFGRYIAGGEWPHRPPRPPEPWEEEGFVPDEAGNGFAADAPPDDGAGPDDVDGLSGDAAGDADGGDPEFVAPDDGDMPPSRDE
jgi:hypothetical protein